MSTKRQGTIERVLRRLFTTRESIVSVESSDLAKDQNLFSKMLTRRGINDRVRISKDPDRKSIIFKLK